MKRYNGNVPSSDIEAACKKAKEIKPDVKNIYMRIEGETLQFVVRKRNAENAIEEHVVHQFICNPYSIKEHNTVIDGELFNGFPMCFSIPLHEKFLENYRKDQGKEYDEGLEFGFQLAGSSVACSLNG
jgi:hypothetical protein